VRSITLASWKRFSVSLTSRLPPCAGLCSRLKRGNNKLPLPRQTLLALRNDRDRDFPLRPAVKRGEALRSRCWLASKRCRCGEAQQDASKCSPPTSPRITTKTRCLNQLLPTVKSSPFKVANNHCGRRKLGAPGVHRNLTRSENRLNGETNTESIRILEEQIRERERTVANLKLALTPSLGDSTGSQQAT